MSDPDRLAQRFETHRDHLRAVALRMLGSSHEADDAVQEAWLRLSRSDAETVDNLGGWLTTVVARVCLDMLRARGAKREVAPDAAPEPADATTPEDQVQLADSVGAALLVVLDTLAPDERLAFVLHDMFAIPFDEIAPIVGRSPVAARKLASRARRRVQSDPQVPDASPATQRQVVVAFLAAARQGDFAALLQLLDPDVVLRPDAVAIEMAAGRASAGAPELSEQMRGPDAVARVFAGRAHAARLALIDGAPGLTWAPGGHPRVVFVFAVTDGRITAVEQIAEADHLHKLDVVLLDG